MLIKTIFSNKKSPITFLPKRNSCNPLGTGDNPEKSFLMYTVNTDGGSRGNPGPSGCAFVIASAGKIVETGKFFLGKMTNNQAEYIGAMLGLQAAQKHGITEIHLIMDSELVIRQLQGIYKVKEPSLKILYQKIKMILADFKTVKYSSVLRERNKLADELANQAMDDEFPIYVSEEKNIQSSFFE